MNQRFTVEEINLISIFTGEASDLTPRDRGKVMQDIQAVIVHLDDEEMAGLSLQAIKKLNAMSDEEFAGMEFIAAE